MLKYEALTKADKGYIRLLFEDFAAGISGELSEKRDLHNTRLRLSIHLCTVVEKYRIVEGVTAPVLTAKDISEEDEDLIEDLLTLHKYKYAAGSEKFESLKDERLFLDIVYRKFDNLVLKYY